MYHFSVRVPSRRPLPVGQWRPSPAFGLYRTNNRIGDKGLKGLSDACAGGAMAQCTYLNLGRNKVGDKGLEALSGALATGVAHIGRSVGFLLGAVRVHTAADRHVVVLTGMAKRWVETATLARRLGTPFAAV